MTYARIEPGARTACDTRSYEPAVLRRFLARSAAPLQLERKKTRKLFDFNKRYLKNRSNWSAKTETIDRWFSV
jgi:hypothetical protein